MRIPTKIKQLLKKPLGKVHTTLKEIKSLSHGHKIVAVGDVCVLALLSMDIPLHLAVYDYKYMRRKLDKTKKQILKRHFKKPYRFKNPHGTISKNLIQKAPEILRKGGAVKIDGEEDLTALVFANFAPKNIHVIYGQPHKGIVLIKKNKKLQKILNQLFKSKKKKKN